jgi:RHS repeat-associated protein
VDFFLVKAGEIVRWTGNAWYTSQHKAGSSFVVNTAAIPVKRWQISPTTGLPFSSTNYPNGSIVISKGSDEEGSESSSMTDFRGNTVQTTIHGSPELTTYYVYDHFGRLRFTIPPEASGNLNPDQAFIDKWAFQYLYDARGRLVKEKRPGTDWQYYIYDQWDRMVLSQDGNQRAKSPKEWSFVKYDAINRVVMTGVITSNNSFEQMVTDVTGGYHEDRNTSAIGYTLTNSFPSITESNLLTNAYFDDYDFLGNSGWDAEGNSFSFQSDALFPEPQFTSVKGLSTGSKIKLLGQNKWLNAVVYYDKMYRPIQSVQEHHLGGTDRTFTGYNFPGWVLKTKRIHNSTIDAATILEEYEYDHGGRLTKHYHTIDNGTRILLAANNYNELGQLVEVNTHSTDEVNFLQSTDYRYNIRGWLTHINNSTLTNDGVNNDDTNDLFGMQIVYHDETQTVHGVNTNPRYNGLISAIKWKTDNKKDQPQERIYGHYYTPDVNQLSQSLYAAKSGSSWTAEPGFYDLTNLSYDKNGNIQTLNRYAEANNARITLDQLTYGYENNGNKLTNVEDAGNPSFGFKNGTVGIPTEYDYDPAGNLVADLNKEMIEVRYNYLNLPEYIEFYDGWKLEYTYDATGYVVKKVLKKGNVPVRQVDYVAGIQYFDNALTLIFTAKGRAVKQSNTYDYEYFLTDHLGSTRIVYGYLRNTDIYRATMEAGNASTEEVDFKNIPSSRYQDPLYNHTGKTLDIPTPDRSALTNGFLGKAIGPAKMLQVNSGDKVTLEVFARYTTSTAGNNTIINNLVAAVTGAFGVVNAGETQAAYQALNSNLPGTSALIPTTTNVPKAYLYYIIFNNSYVYQQFGYFSVPLEAALGHVPLKLEVNVPVNGFLYTYVANESNVSSATSVFFDDFTIIHEKSTYSLRVVESIDYDPFGVVLEGTHYVDISRPLNSYLYQGEFAEFEKLTGWSRFAGRGNYDAVLGRWYSTDPMAHKFSNFSPFAGMGNNPVMVIDPDGRVWHIVGAALIGGIANTWSNWDKVQNPWQAVEYFAVGATAGAVTMVNPLAGASILSGGNLAVDVMNGHPPDFSAAAMDFGFSYFGGSKAKKAHDAFRVAKSDLEAFAEAAAKQLREWKRWNVVVPNSKQTAKELADLGYRANQILPSTIEVNAQLAVKIPKQGVYVLGTTLGQYVGQSKDILKRVNQHFANGGKLAQGELENAVYYSMEGSTILQREVYEHYLITEKYGIQNLINVRLPMGGRLDTYNRMIDDVIKQFNLPR